MTQVGEGIQPPAVESEEKSENKKTPVTIRCIMLYDGTGNNKTNIQSREANNEYYRKTISTWSKIKGKPKGDDSYENGLTNIAALDTYLEDQQAPTHDITLLVYTEGAGTRDNKSDKALGYGIGAGEAGVKNKCEKGIVEAINKIIGSQFKGDDLKPNKHYIKKLTIDLFGFSRGAATARYAVYKLLKDPVKPMVQRLSLSGFETTLVEVCFVGLFDTVSSHGLSFKDDVEKLHLNAISEAKKVLHLTAADEFRKTFSLTTIKSAKEKGEEYYMPGAHSDVGGSYHDASSEDFVLYSGSPEDVKTDQQDLINQGWYTRNEIIYEDIYNEQGLAVQAYTKANRQGIHNAYCKIPLKIMAKKAEEQGLLIKPILETHVKKALEPFDDLQKLDENIYTYAVKDLSQYNRYAPLLCRIRHDHLHMSAKEAIGLWPRFSGSGKARLRTRQIIDG